jgi:hypothetical protein
MKNPWSDLPKNPPFVLTCDQPYIDAFNSVETKTDHKINLDILPEPFHGNVEAPIVVLLLNPGIDGREKELQKSSEYSARLRSSITDKCSIEHFHLTDKFNGPGRFWWEKACKSLRACVDLPTRILSIEFSPYHSRSFSHGHLRFPSQDFSFDLVRRAISREALIVCMRGERFWYGAVPELAGYKRLLKLINPRSATLSENNLPGFDAVLSALVSSSNTSS